MQMSRAVGLAVVSLYIVIALGVCIFFAPAVSSAGRCGDLVSIETHDGTTMRYALRQPQRTPAIVLVLLVGGSGYLNLDDQACPQALTGNSLVRSLNHFYDLGFITALVDAPSDHFDEDGLAGFRITPAHAEDLGKVIVSLRARFNTAVWLVGTSRGTISAANAAARLSGRSAPDGIVLTSALMVGQSGAKKSWVAQSVFDIPLETIRLPILVVGHAADACIRSPATLMETIVARTQGVREQIVTLGEAKQLGLPSLQACEGRSAHGFIGQEAEVAAGIARFIRGGSF